MASPQGEIDQCGLCTGLTCEFNVTDTPAGDLIRVNTEIDLLQGLSLEFSVGVKGMHDVKNTLEYFVMQRRTLGRGD